MECSGECKLIGKALRENIPIIISDWLGEVAGIIPKADVESTPILVDHLPKVLEKIAEAFETGTPDKGFANNEMAKEHGKQRDEKTDFELEDILKEYNLLRKIIVKTLYPFAEFELIPLLYLNQLLDQAIQASVIEYVTIQSGRSQTMISQLNNEKSVREKFVAALTHDMRTPLTTARLSAQIMLKRPDDAEGILKHSPRIITNIDRVDHMIQDLLDASLVKAGGSLNLDFQQCDLEKIVEDTVSDLIALHGPRFITKHLPPITGYWSKSGLRRIIENLANNAVKYGTPGAPITISVLKKPESLNLCISNEGNPLSEMDVHNLFGEFERSSSAKLSGQKGWGIGLTLVRGLVESHGGTINIDPENKTGTTFIINLPLDSRKAAPITPRK